MRALLLLIGFLFVVPAFALPEPTGPVLLTLTGNIANTNVGDSAQFDRKMLAALPQHKLTTTMAWVSKKERPHDYVGFSALDLLELVGGTGDILRIKALNQYVIDVPISDFVDYGAIFAIKKDGKDISIRNLGPIMVLYPFDDNKDLRHEVYYWRAIWQVSSIKVLTNSAQVD
ncbi:hypothetical protein [Marinomonas pollencensis]|uniref:Oxidoreductase molybdopterin-binding domain-containing protein n=1 Tax=Marinomonas pollencensis TaxID=491954 RepID=A0A3E0DP32_9GAMM|nr:hypothetical protein [Marinomonas pollencensis]REG83909.1 hypothetical protein DFP81_105275 [Marinomonas pollencensis]